MAEKSRRNRFNFCAPPGLAIAANKGNIFIFRNE
jgi:hypothetical protein